MCRVIFLAAAVLGVATSGFNDSSSDVAYHANATGSDVDDNVNLVDFRVPELNSTVVTTLSENQTASAQNVSEEVDARLTTGKVQINITDATDSNVTKKNLAVTESTSTKLEATPTPAHISTARETTFVTTPKPTLQTQDTSANVTWAPPEDPPVPVTLTSCEMTTERRLSVLQSPGFPSAYGPDVECRYVVRRYSLDVCSVTFLFNVFDLESSENCLKDYVDLHGEKLCGAKTTGLTRSVPFRSAVDDQVVLRFRSDDSTSGVGFMATVVQQECPPPDCDHQFTGLKFEVRSPGFPGPYDNRQLCDYTVIRAGPMICRIRLQVRLFDVEAADHCDADSLEIKGDKLCGNIPAGEIVSIDFREPLVMLRFRSDRTTTRDGFHLLGTQEECPDGSPSLNATAHLTR